MDKELEYYINEVTTNFKRGTTEMLLLSLLTERDQYAYELSKALKERSHGQFDVQGPSPYTILYRMESRGFVSTWEEKIGRRPRVYYHILPEGERYLYRIKEVYQTVTQGITAVLGDSKEVDSDG